MQKEYIDFKYFEVNQPIGKFYIGIMDYDDLTFISYVDIMRLEAGSEMRDVEIYSGIQRELSEKRSEEISRYINMFDATFPTSIIIHIDAGIVDVNENEKIIKIPYRNNVAKVLDGQHRIRGFKNSKKPGDFFQLNVTLFIGMELEDQAIVFATINQTQTKVNKSLVANLFQFATHRSPQKSAHQIVRALNEKEGSPFKDKIKILGTANDKELETITQATFVDSLLQYMTKDKSLDRDTYKRGKKPSRYTIEQNKTYFLRDLFIDEKEGDIAKIVWNYFKAIQTKWDIAWNTVQPEIILNRSTGFVAFMRFFRDAYLFLAKSNIGTVPTMPEFLSILDKVALKDSDFNKDRFIPGSTGRAKLYQKLKEDTKI